MYYMLIDLKVCMMMFDLLPLTPFYICDPETFVILKLFEGLPSSPTTLLPPPPS
jgi:hypothetical protein